VFKTIYDSFISKGYIIKSPSPSEFKKTIEEIYTLITTLYSDFPVFKDIEKEDFLEIFKSFKSIINYSMVKMGYYNNKPVGFFISIPNYHNIVYHLNVKNLIKINKIKKNPDEYVMLYMGVLPEHRGLGSALAQSIIQELKASKLPSIGALARDGKVTQNYAKEKIENKYEYVLLEKIIKEKRNESNKNLGQRT
jgi:GNAT superfamily N-acetyltransferase